MQSQIGRHLHALDNDIKLHALPEKHHVTQPESWNHHTLWRKTMVMESQTQTLVWLWNGQKHSFTVKPDFSVGSNQKPSAARKELRCPLISTREPFKWCWFHVGATTQDSAEAVATA
ncbi:uncharacterized protein LOC117125625 isoform X2 [Brassica rapa]|uniref:uncharacterized protein LOC117125625 isoform X2 n=1 Tax=Brassica campestris TaxID=3711 RepID=UPI00142D90B1|nr:uncharacterized protein LOC117125625 isoform X2 [Brassica rapa]